MITDLKLIKPAIGIDKYHWEDKTDAEYMLYAIRFHKGYKAFLKVDYNEGVFTTKGELIKAFKAFSEK